MPAARPGGRRPTPGTPKRLSEDRPCRHPGPASSPSRRPH
jgi:hypothetical protein